MIDGYSQHLQFPKNALSFFRNMLNLKLRMQLILTRANRTFLSEKRFSPNSLSRFKKFFHYQKLFKFKYFMIGGCNVVQHPIKVQYVIKTFFLTFISTYRPLNHVPMTWYTCCQGKIWFQTPWFILKLENFFCQAQLQL